MDSKPVYLSAEALGIPGWEREGLIALVGPLSRGEIAVRMNFSSLRPDQVHPCRTVGCLLGWACHFSKKPYNNARLFGGAHDLYYPPFYGTSLGSQDVAQQASLAVLNFLVTGDPQWDVVMSGAA